MYGAIISLIIAAWLIVFHGAPIEMVFLKATGFLYSWYLITTIIMGSILALILLSFMLLGTALGGLLGSEAGDTRGGIIGSVAGLVATMIGGTTLSALILFKRIANRALFILGAYLLHAGLILDEGIYAWNELYLILGGIMLFIALKNRVRITFGSDIKALLKKRSKLDYTQKQ